MDPIVRPNFKPKRAKSLLVSKHLDPNLHTIRTTETRLHAQNLGSDKGT